MPAWISRRLYWQFPSLYPEPLKTFTEIAEYL